MTGARTPNQLDTRKLKKSTVKRRLQFTSPKTESSESSMVCEWRVFSYAANICRSQFSSHIGLYISLVPMQAFHRSFFRSRGKSVGIPTFFHGCKNSCEGRPGYEANYITT